MLLFNKLEEPDQHNSIHFCMHIVVEDMLDDGVEIEPFSDEDKKMKGVLERVIAEAKTMPPEEQFEFVVHHEEAGQLVFDIALDMARSAFYPSDDELVIHYESLRPDMEEDDEETDPQTEVVYDAMEEINTLNKKSNTSLN